MIFRHLIQHMLESVVVTDASGAIEIVNPAFTKVTGYSPKEVIGKNPRILKSGRQNELFYKNMWNSINQNNHWHGEIWNRRKNGEIYPEWLSISAVRNKKNKITNYVGVFTDITLQKISENTLHHLAHHDSLTGLPNRALFWDRLNQAIAQSNRNKNLFALLYVDLDHFKPINDTLGHWAGDLLLTRVAQRLKNCIREGDTLARLGGDEFVIILLDVADTKSTEKIATQILEALSKPFQLRNKVKSYITASVGISMYPFDGTNADHLLRSADRAMYQAKKMGMNQYCFTSSFTNNSEFTPRLQKNRAKVPTL